MDTPLRPPFFTHRHGFIGCSCRCWYLGRRGPSGCKLLRLRDRPVQVPQAVAVGPWSLVLRKKRQHVGPAHLRVRMPLTFSLPQDRQLFLQKHCLHRCSLVVPNLLYVEFTIVSLWSHFLPLPYRRWRLASSSIPFSCGGTRSGRLRPSSPSVCLTVS